MFKKLLASAVIALSLFASAPKLAAKPTPNWLRSVVALQADSRQVAGEFDNICTASSINAPKHYWVTAAHCILERDDFTGQLLDDASEPRYIDGKRVLPLDYDAKLDLAVLVGGPYAPDNKLADKDVYQGQAIAVAGHPYGYPDLFLTQGYVAATQADLGDVKPYMVFDVAGAPGNSGSPVFNKKHELVSVLQVGFGGYSPVTGGSPWSVLKEFAGKYFRLR